MGKDALEPPGDLRRVVVVGGEWPAGQGIKMLRPLAWPLSWFRAGAFTHHRRRPVEEASVGSNGFGQADESRLQSVGLKPAVEEKFGADMGHSPHRSAFHVAQEVRHSVLPRPEDRVGMEHLVGPIVASHTGSERFRQLVDGSRVEPKTPEASEVR